MDSEIPIIGKETCAIRTHTKHFPVIEEKKLKKGEAHFKKSSRILLKPKLNFPQLKPNKITQQRSDAGEPGGFHSDIFAQQTNSVFESSLSVLALHDKDIERSKLQDSEVDSKVIGISKCKIGFEVPSSEVSADSFESKEENLEESKALKRWEFWTNDKKRMQNILSKKVGRNPCDLQIQESDKYRAIFEDKLLLTYAQIPEPDKWRGHPFMWKKKLKIGPRREPKDCEVSFYANVQTKLEKGEIPEIQFVGTPEVVRKEKGLICTSQNSALKKWEKIPYREEQILRFKQQRKKMKPCNIIMDELAVVGVKILQVQEEYKEFIKPPNIPKIMVTEEKSNSSDYHQSIFSLAIDGKEMKYELGTENSQDSEEGFVWHVDFGVNKIGSLVEKVLRVENQGTIAVTYDWVSKNSEQRQSPDLLNLKPYEPWFFFNKNSGLFLPGQMYELKFYHYAKFSGIQKEIWYLKTKPFPWNNQKIGAISLSAVVTEDFTCKNDTLKSFLRDRVRDTVIKFTLEVIFYKVFNLSEGLHEIEYRSLFFEKELFEYHNPKHYYHSAIVKELKGLFNEILFKNQTEWDLSFNSLVAVVRTNSTKQEKSFLLHKIAENSRKLFRRNYLLVKKVKKYKMTYEILCKMVTLIEEDYNYIRSLFSQKKKDNTNRSSVKMKEKDEVESNGTSVVFEIKPVDFIFFQTMLYLKVYERLSEAVENVVGVIETCKLFEPWKQSYKLEKPFRRN